ncbi:hypothetical protein PAECIP111892_01773 [Paenibacillus auburnensis]|uniref:Uncharacterized protein n=1 Tax=Paenibacillus auburnensis TaxID=2905649 RepID=A0ABN8FY40_9BACL|nr:hypothetical protein [Paenibacillus auburnensis]CAH1194628.1 hypothetical protein PAECIP111892_01773 [Paenibacillus auburnensis]
MSFESDIREILNKLEIKQQKGVALQDTIHGVLSNLLQRLVERDIPVHLSRNEEIQPNVWEVRIGRYEFSIYGQDAIEAIEQGDELENFLATQVRNGLEKFLKI